jgi:hypothetical protein
MVDCISQPIGMEKSRPIMGGLAGLLDIDPNAVAPVTMAFVLAPSVLLVPGPFPVVWMYAELETRLIVVPFDVPTVAFIIAGDFG